jgi:hypothetical protein
MLRRSSFSRMKRLCFSKSPRILGCNRYLTPMRASHGRRANDKAEVLGKVTGRWECAQRASTMIQELRDRGASDTIVCACRCTDVSHSFILSLAS